MGGLFDQRRQRGLFDLGGDPETGSVTDPQQLEMFTPQQIMPQMDYQNTGAGRVISGRMAKSIAPARATNALKTEGGYAYHATNVDRVREIAEQGLKPHQPWEFTDQDMWPDGSVDPRVYFSPKADNVWQFAPEEGASVVLRVKNPGTLRSDGTGDIYSRKPVSPEDIEYLGEDGQYHPLKGGQF